MPKKHNKIVKSDLPTVSICTITFNRRPFIPALIKAINSQTYPQEKIEWIIIDDGTDKIGDLVKNIPFVKYFSYDEKMTIGKKRNLSHEKSTGKILVYMDDDDFYPPERIEHAVDKLLKGKNLIAGSSEIYLYFKELDEMYKFGPYGPNHSTAATFAFKRELLKMTSYNEEAALAEEKHFLKDYTIGLTQLDPLKTILVFSHPQNTFDKKQLISEESKFVKKSNLKVNNFIKDNELREFYTNTLMKELSVYKAGEVSNKPDVLKQTQEIHKKREQMVIDEQKKQKSGIVIVDGNGVKQDLSVFDTINLLKQLQEKNKELELENQKLKQILASKN
jgi:glycosyltransferase involved in cell wall biosynthesis